MTATLNYFVLIIEHPNQCRKRGTRYIPGSVYLGPGIQYFIPYDIVIDTQIPAEDKRFTAWAPRTACLWYRLMTRDYQNMSTCIRRGVASPDELHPAELHPAAVARPPEAALFGELTHERHHPLRAILVLNKSIARKSVSSSLLLHTTVDRYTGRGLHVPQHAILVLNKRLAP